VSEQTPSVDPVLCAIKELRAEFSAFREQFVGVLGTNKRIEPEALYSIAEAAEKVAISRATLCRKLRARIIVARGGTKGCPWQIRGSELLKLGGKTQ
jgi:hypothetical protein